MNNIEKICDNFLEEHKECIQKALIILIDEDSHVHLKTTEEIIETLGLTLGALQKLIEDLKETFPCILKNFEELASIYNLISIIMKRKESI